MPRLIWAPAAVGDLARLRRFLLVRNPDAARWAMAAIQMGINLVGEHPEAGRPMVGMAPEFRELVIGFGAGAYVALYHFDGGDVVILAVRHGREAGY